MLRFAAGNLVIATFCGIFAAVYEHFSFGVWSGQMVFSFAPCLTAGMLLVFAALGKRFPGRVCLETLTASAITFAVGMISAGVVEIYGTENDLLNVYPVAGGILLLAAAVTFFLPVRAELERESI